MTVPADRRLIEVSGTEALWLLEGSAQGRLVYVQRELAVVRPAAHVMEYGRLVVRAPVQAATIPGRALLTYQVDEIRTPDGTGWTVSAHGPADVIADPDEAAHYRRTLPGWAHGPHDTLLRLHPQAVSGFRLARTVSGAGR
ncbi:MULTISPECIES: pyridoxamine 5'-phosphate oxidase family protein [unclassified Streptomyces]|uniref:pyridoxamine 5'-phosphate oxidase family protein n=1 Tax=unclassified Streptomyces TaxID=2593676 RepID=UPI00224E0838|nr:pyridoxamine 5'-phosphate oxidase family protein [Streptomyces sp. NBC_00047]MCX5613294.1 pyridoxamine 5'-phosphate oxidase family protein [Streptomyces sp. NBC_00047]